jgi:hypothetical protein
VEALFCFYDKRSTCAKGLQQSPPVALFCRRTLSHHCIHKEGIGQS